MKVETHNHPTAISPFPGAATGSGGEIRDEGATGRGARPKAGLAGFSVSNLRIPGWRAAVGSATTASPARIASALDIMLEGPIGAAAFNNEFGRPNLAGYFRSFEIEAGGELRGYHKPIMIAGGVGNIAARDAFKLGLPEGSLLIQLGGPGMLIGMGGGAASSMATGSNTEDLDFDSVQRGNAEIQRRAQEVIDRCWQLGEANPILSIHDVGAGGLSNALPELAHGAGRGASLDLRAVPSEEPGMSPREIWCNEAQERYVLAIAPEQLETFRAICERERCPFAVLGEATAEQQLRARRRALRQQAGGHGSGRAARQAAAHAARGRAPRARAAAVLGRGHRAGRGLPIACCAIPTVADKTFLITIGDRTVGGLCARDQFVGPWQVPVADVRGDAAGFRRAIAGEAYCMGERAPLAVIDAPASGRMAVGEALTNLAAAPVRTRATSSSPPTGWRRPGIAGEDAALFDTVRAVALELCPALGISIPVGKDSLSMKTTWEDGGPEEGSRRAALADRLGLRALCRRAPHAHAAAAPGCGRDATDPGRSRRGQNRLGGSILAQVYGQIGDAAPDVDDAGALKRFFDAVQALNRDGLLLAYHDRSDGGLFATLCEMAFAAHCGLTLDLDAICVGGEQRARARGAVRRGTGRGAAGARAGSRRGARTPARRQACRRRPIGSSERGATRSASMRGAAPVFDATRIDLQRAWSETTWRMQALRDNPDCAREEYDRILDADDPGLHAKLDFDPAEDVAAPYIASRRDRKIAILREQGVNGQVEMAAAFDRAGFDARRRAHERHHCRARVALGLQGLAACGGFSYGDVLGAGEGWAKSILFNARARDEFEAFFGRSDVFALGVCNGCQMMSNLREIIPGAAHWPQFVRTGRSSSRRASSWSRWPRARRCSSPAWPAAACRWPRRTARAGRYSPTAAAQAEALVALRFVDNRGAATELYPANPNGSPAGITGLTTADGRFTILMPHPERVFRSVQHVLAPAGLGRGQPVDAHVPQRARMGGLSRAKTRAQRSA